MRHQGSPQSKFFLSLAVMLGIYSLRADSPMRSGTGRDGWPRAVWQLSQPGIISYHPHLCALLFYMVAPGRGFCTKSPGFQPGQSLVFGHSQWSSSTSCWVALCCFFFWPHCEACGIFVLQPGIKPMPPAVEAPSPHCWTTREVPLITFYTLTVSSPKLW